MIRNPLFKAISESSAPITNNIEANLVVNNIIHLQESSPVTSKPKYTVEAIPMVKTNINEQETVAIEAEMIDLVVERQGISESEVLQQVYDYLVREGVELNGKPFEKSDITILINHQDPQRLYESVTESASHIDCRVKALQGFCESVEAAKQFGVKIAFVK